MDEVFMNIPEDVAALMSLIESIIALVNKVDPSAANNKVVSMIVKIFDEIKSIQSV
jgi:hypothetical protein